LSEKIFNSLDLLFNREKVFHEKEYNYDHKSVKSMALLTQKLAKNKIRKTLIRKKTLISFLSYKK